MMRLRPPSSLLAQRFAGDKRGVAAIEFAFIAPILIVFYLGMAEACQLLIAKRRIDHAGSAVADLVAQANTVTPTDLEGIRAISTTILAPFSAAPDVFSVRVTSVKDNAQGEPKVEWSWPTGGPAKGATPPFVTATPLNPNESVVVSEVSYNYTSAIGYFVSGVQIMKHKAELRPRKNDEVVCVGC